MRAFLLVVAVSALCFDEPESNCTQANGCTLYPGSCYRVGVACGATCSEPDCVLGASPTNYETCSKCTENCGTHENNATCSASGVCQWQPAMCSTYVAPTPAPVECENMESAPTCTTRSGCVWLEFSETQCGVTTTAAFCTSCNSSFSSHPLSAFKSKIGSTCTWAMAGNYTASYVITPKAISQSNDCTPLHDHSTDNAEIGRAHV